MNNLSINLIIKKLKENNYSLSTCESCTSGLLCSTLTNIEGSSEVIQGGYIAYSNLQKINIGVSPDTIEKYGVYSEECSKEMALCCKRKMHTNIGIGVTGTLGNLDNKNKDSEIGTIYYTIALNDTLHSNKIKLDNLILSKTRDIQKEFVVNCILNYLILNI